MAKHESYQIEDRNVIGYSPLMLPHDLKSAVPLTKGAYETVEVGRESIKSILNGSDERTLLVLGPCSIHDLEVAKDYADRLNKLRKKVADTFIIAERTYFEKPRTTVGWKGLINEPHLDGQEKVNEGLVIARKVLAYNAKIGLPSATEFLDPFTPQWIADLISLAGIGARTVQSPTHRQMASGLSMPVGFKNGTTGDVQVAIDAVIAASKPQWFFGLDQSGKPSVVRARGNADTHIVLRGGKSGTNYDSASIKGAQKMLMKHNLSPKVMVDCSHGNSGKDYTLQPAVFENVIEQISEGNKGIMGIMFESNINPGRQDIPKDPKTLKYGVSVTDACIGWGTTEKLVMDACERLQ